VRAAALLAVLGVGIVVVGPRLAGGPLGPLPGGRLHGRLGAGDPPPALAAVERTVALELTPESPYSVTTWIVPHEGRLYVPGDFLTPWKRWPQAVLGDPRVRLRLGGEIYPRRAVRVEEPQLIEALRAAFGAKYALAPDGLAARSEVWFFALGPPGPAVGASGGEGS